MSNLDAPRGARYMGTLGGGGANPRTETYTHDVGDANPIFSGDFVKIEADGNVAPANLGDVLLGVCVGVDVDMDVAATEYPGYGPASTAVTVQVIVEPLALYAVQADGVVNADDVGQNADIVGTDGSTSTGRSAHEMGAVLATGVSGQLRIKELSKIAENDITAANAEWIVMINESSFLTQAGL